MKDSYSTSVRREAVPASAGIGSGATPLSKRGARRRVAVVLLLLLVGAGLTWYFRRDTRLSVVKELQRELFSAAGRQLSADERRQKFTQLRLEMNLLSAAQRQGLRGEGMKRRTEEMNRYFRLLKEERIGYLDDLIAREQKRRSERQAQADSNNAGSPSGPPRPGRPGGPNILEPASERDKRREEFLDSMPATQRAEWTEFRKELSARRQQLGLPAFGRP